MFWEPALDVEKECQQGWKKVAQLLVGSSFRQQTNQDKWIGVSTRSGKGNVAPKDRQMELFSENSCHAIQQEH